jgi:predicted ThiF/HesA family dinucleotide-utilizing enzyme
VAGHPQVPEALRIGRRALEDLAGVTLLQDWTRSSHGTWSIELELKMISWLAGPIPQVTRWFVVADYRYPRGSLELFPSKVGGITTTFWHQLHNSNRDDDLPWRRGKICVTEPTARVRNRNEGVEPPTAEARLRWNVKRALEWLDAAASGRLAQPGDPYEVPPVSSPSGPLVVFNEDAATFEAWITSTVRFGTMTLKSVSQNPSIRALTSFADSSAGEITTPLWGFDIEHAPNQETGVWIRIPDEPVIEQWHVPDTWDEISELLNERGINIQEVFASTYPYLRNGSAAVLAIGFPIPEAVAGPTVCIHWFFIQLPTICSRSERKRKHGLRNCLFWERDRTLKLTGEIDWLRSENWSTDQLGSRGQLAAPLRKQRILLLGAGALGSSLAELLVRGGASAMTILDGDKVKAGNLVRHALGVGDIGRGKATQLAKHLNSISPHAKVEGVDLAFSLDNEQLRSLEGKHTLILDCTADDGVANDLAQVAWSSGTVVVSLALSFEAERLYVYAQRDRFDCSQMFSLLSPYIEEDLVQHPLESFPREGIGCWHPVFPARIERVLKAVCLTVSFLSEDLDAVTPSGHFMVLK